MVVAALGLPALIAACGRGDKTLLEADPGAVPAAPTYDDVRAILDLNCVPCHKGQGSDLTIRPNLETCDGLMGDLGRVVQDAVELENMPPGAWPRSERRGQARPHPLDRDRRLLTLQDPCP